MSSARGPTFFRPCRTHRRDQCFLTSSAKCVPNPPLCQPTNQSIACTPEKEGATRGDALLNCCPLCQKMHQFHYRVQCLPRGELNGPPCASLPRGCARLAFRGERECADVSPGLDRRARRHHSRRRRQRPRPWRPAVRSQAADRTE
jgi:hypothetical protein